MQCQGCENYIMATLYTPNGSNAPHTYLEHYPLGQPNDEVPKEIPTSVAGDYQEALRCQFVKGYSSTAEMCRRAIETSCLELGAPYNAVLENMIDWLEEQRIITPALKKVAHQVRLGGNRGAHPWKEGEPVAKPVPVITIEQEHAEAIVEFTKHFLEHVYVIPGRLPTFDFSKPKLDKNAPKN